MARPGEAVCPTGKYTNGTATACACLFRKGSHTADYVPLSRSIKKTLFCRETVDVAYGLPHSLHQTSVLLLMLLCFFGEKCYDAKLLSNFGEKRKCIGAIGQKLRVGPVHAFFTRN